MSELTSLTAGQPILYRGNRITTVSPELAAAFRAGDSVVVVPDTGDVLHLPAVELATVDAAVRSAHHAFRQLGDVGNDRISSFYDAFAARLADDVVCDPILRANELDVVAARASGRSTTRLAMTESMRADMVAGLLGWRDAVPLRDGVLETVHHDGWWVEQRRAALGVVGFVFEGRPNVFADATGVMRSGNTVVFRIGSDALGTARAVMQHALRPALADAGLPSGSVGLVDSTARAAGHALFSHPLVSLAVARGSGGAVAQLGAVARQAGVPVSLHGTGGAWLVTGDAVDRGMFESAVYHSLDRKVCNTLNVCCVLRRDAVDLVPVFLHQIERAAERCGANAKLHVTPAARAFVPDGWFHHLVPISRAGGPVPEAQAEVIEVHDLGTEWEWEKSPEVSLHVVDSVADAVATFNRFSPRLAASLISTDRREHDVFYDTIDAPFVGNGFTRWVDGQFALGRPELGLSNWQSGRLLARSAILSGDSVFTVRTRMTQTDAAVHR